MHSSFYLSVFAILYFYLSFEVIKQRRVTRTAYGYGKNVMAGHVGAHSNFASYTPIFLILLIMSENQWALPFWSVHLIGIAFLIGRLLHFTSLTKHEHLDPPSFRFRVAGMGITFTCMLLLAVYILVRYLLALAIAQ
ncbi:MAG: MAPEG family protein [Bdellovibrionales bacterium]|nr:MAPEG family protein [Bdellovibrionales bacterium]